MPSPTPVESPLAEKAREIKARLLSGENLPLAEVVAFLSTATGLVQKEVKKLEKKPTDVDFF